MYNKYEFVIIDITSEDIEIWKKFSEIYLPLIDILKNDG